MNYKILKLEETCDLDIRKINRDKLINDDVTDFYIVHRNDYYQVSINNLILNINNQKISMIKIPCNYGGFRYYLDCPKCESHSEVLYFKNKIFLCRNCHHLPYSCQIEDDINQLIRKIRKIRRRLNVPTNLSVPIVQKPKGMHWKTFMKLKHKEIILSQKYCEKMKEILKLDLDF